MILGHILASSTITKLTSTMIPTGSLATPVSDHLAAIDAITSGHLWVGHHAL